VKLRALLESQDMDFDRFLGKLPMEITSKLKTIQQDPVHHPEGNLYNHMKIVFNQAKKRGIDFAIAALFHDLGKIDTYSGPENPHFYDHEKKSLEYLDKYLHLFPYENKEMIYEIVKHHMRVRRMPEMRPGKKKALEDNPYYRQMLDFQEDDLYGRKE
jgi:hypothetical protein